jgi:hypothetical protein
MNTHRGLRCIVSGEPALALLYVHVALLGRSAPGYDDLLRHLITWAEAHIGGELVAAGHRVVHGGTMCSQPVLVTEKVVRDLAPLLPLHLPHNLAAIECAAPNAPELAASGLFRHGLPCNDADRPLRLRCCAVPEALK